jgi:hypothetical protein
VTIKDTKFKKFTEYTGKFSDLLAYYKQEPRTQDNKFNSTRYNEVLYDPDNKWRGGSYQEMKEPVKDLQALHSLEKSISASKVWKNLATQLGQASVRRRTRDRFDGDYDVDRKWDIEPFTKRSTAMLTKRIVRINAESSFSSYVSAADIDRYGAFITAIVSLLEKSGTTVELWANYTAKDHTDAEGSGFRFKIKIKDSSEYMPLQSILRTLSSVWYRRAVFGLIVQSAEVLGDHVLTGLGRPFSFGVPWEMKDNCLNIYSVPSINEQEKITESLMKLVGK